MSEKEKFETKEDLLERKEIELARIGQERKADLILAIKDQVSFQEASAVFKKVLKINAIAPQNLETIRLK